MPRAVDGLFDRVASFEALYGAALRAAAGKRRVPMLAAFLANLEKEILRLERQSRQGVWRPGRYVEIEVTDPKRRLVSAAPFRDRVVHHALHSVVAPLSSAPYFALFADDPARLEAWRVRAAAFLARRRLSLHPASAGNRNDNIGFRVASTLRCRNRRGHGRGGCAWVRPGPAMMRRRPPDRRRRHTRRPSWPSGRRVPAARSKRHAGWRVPVDGTGAR